MSPEAEAFRDVRFETPRGARFSEVVGAGCVSFAFWLFAFFAGLLVAVIAGTWIGDEHFIPLMLAISTAVFILWAWPHWLWRRLIFSITLGPEGIVFGSWPRKAVPYGAVELVRMFPEGTELGNDRWVEVTVAGVKRRIFLGARAVECALEVFRRSPGAVLIDEKEEERFHVDTPRPLDNLRLLRRGYRYSGYAHLLAGGAIFVVSAFMVLGLIGRLFGKDELTWSHVKGTVVFLVTAVVSIGFGVYYLRKAGKFKDALDRLEAGGAAEGSGVPHATHAKDVSRIDTPQDRPTGEEPASDAPAPSTGD